MYSSAVHHVAPAQESLASIIELRRSHDTLESSKAKHPSSLGAATEPDGADDDPLGTAGRPAAGLPADGLDVESPRRSTRALWS